MHRHNYSAETLKSLRVTTGSKNIQFFACVNDARVRRQFSFRYHGRRWNRKERQRFPRQSPEAGPVQPRPDQGDLEGEDHR